MQVCPGPPMQPATPSLPEAWLRSHILSVGCEQNIHMYTSVDPLRVCKTFDSLFVFVSLGRDSQCIPSLGDSHLLVLQ